MTQKQRTISRRVAWGKVQETTSLVVVVVVVVDGCTFTLKQNKTKKPPKNSSLEKEDAVRGKNTEKPPDSSLGLKLKY